MIGQFINAGVSIEAGYRRYTAACFASHRRLVCLDFHQKCYHKVVKLPPSMGYHGRLVHKLLKPLYKRCLIFVYVAAVDGNWGA